MVLAALAVQALLLAQVPSYASPAHEQSVHGTIAGFDGKYHLRLRDDRGYFDDVTLHQGTIIAPRGLRLQAGMRVTIRGAADGATFDADEIDAPDETAPAESYGSTYGYGTVGMWGAPYYGWDNSVYAPYGGYYGPYNGYYYAPYVVAPPVYVIQNPATGPTPAPPHRTFRRPLSPAEQPQVMRVAPPSRVVPQYVAPPAPPPRAPEVRQMESRPAPPPSGPNRH